MLRLMCSVDGCGRKEWAKGKCQRHYTQEWRRESGWYAKNAERLRARQRERHSLAANDPEYRAKKRESYHRWREANKDREKERKRLGRGLWQLRSHGLTPTQMHGYWAARDGRCDFCDRPYPDPAIGRPVVAVDHDRAHCEGPTGCIECVRGVGHRECNMMEGWLRKARALGLITDFSGPLAEYLADPPLQRWLRLSRTSL